MDKQQRSSSDTDATTNTLVVVDDDERASEWEAGLPNLDNLTPLSQSLIPHHLATAFSISPEPHRTLLDVNRASDDTISALRANNSFMSFRSNNNNNTRPPPPADADVDPTATMMVDVAAAADSRNSSRLQEADSAIRTDDTQYDVDDQFFTRALKRPRLVWTPQLHKRFVQVVSVLGLNNAVPKTVMQMMNVDGLTRENVASHLQKYRLYLKRQSSEGPALSDHHLFNPKEPYPHHLCQQQQQQQQQTPNRSFDSHHQFNILQQQQQQQHHFRDWSSASNYASLASPAYD